VISHCTQKLSECVTLGDHNLVASTQVSTTLGAAIPEERAHRGYIEGIAIWVAILLVTGVGKQQLPLL
jgi:hypothetical protein